MIYEGMSRAGHATIFSRKLDHVFGRGEGSGWLPAEVKDDHCMERGELYRQQG